MRSDSYSPRTCYIGLLVSRPDYEGQPNVILESMAARLPFITWDCPVMSELVQDGVTGLVVKNDSPAETAKAMGGRPQGTRTPLIDWHALGRRRRVASDRQAAAAALRV